MENEYRFKTAANGYILTVEEYTKDDDDFSHVTMKDFVFTDKESFIAWLQYNLK